MHAEDDTLNLLPIRYNYNAYPRVDNSCGNNYSTVFHIMGAGVAPVSLRKLVL